MNLTPRCYKNTDSWRPPSGLANDRQKNPMACLNDNPVLEKGTFFRVGSSMFVADGTGGFENC